MTTEQAKPDIDFETAYLGAVLATALGSLKQKHVDALIGVANAFLAKDPKGRAKLLSNVKQIYEGVAAGQHHS